MSVIGILKRIEIRIFDEFHAFSEKSSNFGNILLKNIWRTNQKPTNSIITQNLRPQKPIGGPCL